MNEKRNKISVVGIVPTCGKIGVAAIDGIEDSLEISLYESSEFNFNTNSNTGVKLGKIFANMKDELTGDIDLVVIFCDDHHMMLPKLYIIFGVIFLAAETMGIPFCNIREITKPEINMTLTGAIFAPYDLISKRVHEIFNECNTVDLEIESAYRVNALAVAMTGLKNYTAAKKKEHTHGTTL